jgi:hypothetical protein
MLFNMTREESHEEFARDESSNNLGPDPEGSFLC